MLLGEGVSHSVFTREKPMVVFSFHTCVASELLEVETVSGRSRKYEEFSVK